MRRTVPRIRLLESWPTQGKLRGSAVLSHIACVLADLAPGDVSLRAHQWRRGDDNYSTTKTGNVNKQKEQRESRRMQSVASTHACPPRRESSVAIAGALGWLAHPSLPPHFSAAAGASADFSSFAIPPVLTRRGQVALKRAANLSHLAPSY
jgi:hypothetical protein